MRRAEVTSRAWSVVTAREPGRNRLAPRDELAGPALIEEPQTTTVVPASFAAYIESGGMIVMERKK